jgi:hydroxylysine kinase
MAEILNKATEDEERRKDEKPVISVSEAVAAAKLLYGLDIHDENREAVKELDSYDDRNFYICGMLPSSDRVQHCLLKIHNGVESDRLDQLQSQNEVMIYLSSKGFVCPYPIKGVQGDLINFIDLKANAGNSCQKRHAVRLLTWVNGKTLSSTTVTLEKLVSAGRYLGDLTTALSTFDHPGAHRIHLWDQNNTHFIKAYVQTIDSEEVKKVVHEVILDFEQNIVGSPGLRQSVIMGDFNDANIIMSTDENTASGIIDFGDMIYSNLVSDLSVGMAYSMLSPPAGIDRVSAACALLEGFSEKFDLESSERGALRTLTAARIATSVTLGALSIAKDPNNEYLKLHSKPGRQALVEFWKVDKERVENLFDDSIKAGISRR